jgi:hypothetical protein
MENNDFINTWEKEKHIPERNRLDRTMITEYLKKKVSRDSWAFNFSLVFYLSVILACIVLLSMNLYGYRNNPVILFVESGLLVLSLIFLVYGFFILIRIREINNFSNDLQKLLQLKIKFLRFYYELWLIMTAAVVWILSFALNSFIDNQGGFYRINNIGFFVIISLVMLIFIYGVQKLATEISMRALKAYLADLEDSYLDRTDKIESRRKKLRVVSIILGIILTITCILGILKFFDIF